MFRFKWWLIALIVIVASSAFADRQLLINVWDYCKGKQFHIGGLDLLINDDLFVFPSRRGEDFVEFGVRLGDASFFPDLSSMSVMAKDETADGFFQFVKGAVTNCGAKECVEIEHGACVNDNKVSFLYVEFELYVPELSSEYHAYYFSTNDNVLFEYHGNKVEFDVYKWIIMHAKSTFKSNYDVLDDTLVSDMSVCFNR